jgi:hypothetical protein
MEGGFQPTESQLLIEKACFIGKPPGVSSHPTPLPICYYAYGYVPLGSNKFFASNKPISILELSDSTWHA